MIDYFRRKESLFNERDKKILLMSFDSSKCSSFLISRFRSQGSFSSTRQRLNLYNKVLAKTYERQNEFFTVSKAQGDMSVY